VLGVDPRRPLPETNDTKIEGSPFNDILRDVLLQHYEFDRELAGTWVFRRKAS